MSNVLEEHYERWFKSVIRVPRSAKVPLVTAYLNLFKNDRNQAVKVINRACSTNYTRKRFREWERGAVALPRSLQTHMQIEVCKARFGKAAIPLLDLLDIKRGNSDLL